MVGELRVRHCEQRHTGRSSYPGARSLSVLYRLYLFKVYLELDTKDSPRVDPKALGKLAVRRHCALSWLCAAHVPTTVSHRSILFKLRNMAAAIVSAERAWHRQ